MRPSQTRVVFALAFMPLAVAQAQDKIPAPQLFPFVLPWDDASKTVVDVSGLNPAPLTEKSRITVKGSQFQDQTGRRVKFFGVNFTFQANFPDHADAEKVAARLHKLGFNAVRLHHMDGLQAPRGIWDPNFKDLQHVDAGQLDRLDYLVSQFSKNGIYVDLNLHVARRFGPADGFPDADKLPANGKVTAWFEPKMVTLQKQYAHDLLTHKNPYTGYTWAQDPAVGIVEIHNEDTLVGAARSGELPQLPAYYRDEVVKDWNAFLKEKYHTTEGMLAAWNAGLPPEGDNLVQNGQFAQGTTGWTLEQHDPARGSVVAEDIPAGGKAPAGRAIHLKTDAVDEQTWHLQLNYNGLNFADGTGYTVSFWARSTRPGRRMTVYTKMDQDPWTDVGLREGVPLSTEWKRYSLSFKADKPLGDHSRLTFVMGDAVGDIWLANVSVKANGALELPADQSLENGNVDLVTPSTARWGQDSTAYLMEVEAKFAAGMKDYIQQDLGCKAPVTCSQANFGGFSGVWRESQMDFVDTHAYWQHPRFPGRAWDMNNWTIQNRAMVADGGYGTFPGLAIHRVQGKPFTVTEYNHPAPNDFSAETIPMVMSYAAYQDWDGVFLFEYATGNVWAEDRIKNYFTSDSHPGKMAFVPVMAELFFRAEPGGVPSTKTLVVPSAQAVELGSAYPSMGDVWQSAGLTNKDAIYSRIGIQLNPTATKPQLLTSMAMPAFGRPPLKQFDWTVNDPQTGSTFSYASPVSRVAVIHDAQNRQPALKGWSFTPAATGRPFAALALSSMDGKPVSDAGSLVLAAVGDVENQEMGWNQDRSSVGTKWGHGPTQVEGIMGKVAFPTKGKAVKVFALDPTGVRGQEVPSSVLDGQVNFEIGPQYKTLWYEIAVTP